MEIISVSRKTSLECERPANRPEQAASAAMAGVDDCESRPRRPRSALMVVAAHRRTTTSSAEATCPGS
jgi:hypothetical protein